MESLEAELERARDLDVGELADAIETIGFECTRCGACCKAEDDDPHTATVFPDEVRELQDAASEQDGAADDADYDWRDVARPMPYGLEDEPGDPDAQSGTTFEWALQTDACGDCAFYEERDDSAAAGGGDEAADVGPGYCTVHDSRPLICQTYPFSLALGGTSQPMGEAVDEAGLVRAHECEGLGREIDREDALALAETLRERAVRELEEALAVREQYEPVEADDDAVVVYDSEGPKDRDGRPIGAGRDAEPGVEPTRNGGDGPRD